MMGLAAPLFLLGLLAVALPFWLHRLQTQSSERKPFSSAMLLETAAQEVHVRKKLKYLLLLAARILLLTLLVLAFARPFIPRPAQEISATDAGTLFLVVDTSASMGRAGVDAQVRTEARRALAAAPDGALLQVAAADDGLRVVHELSGDPAGARAAAAALEVGGLRLDYGQAMAAAERLAAALPPPVNLHFISDFQASAMPARFADVVRPGIASFTPRVVGTGEPFNWSVDFLRETADGLDIGVSGSGDRERMADVEIFINGVSAGTRGLSQTGQQIMHFDVPVYEAGDNRIEARINTDDDFAADNARYHVVDRVPAQAVPLLTRDRAGLPVTYLSAALESAGDWHALPVTPADFDTRTLRRHGWAIIDDIGIADAQLEAALAEFVANGGNLLAFAGDRAGALERLPLTGHRQRTDLASVQSVTPRGVGQVDTRHPALSHTEGWQGVNIMRSLSLEAQEGDAVLARLTDNQPWLIERRIGAGRVLLMPAMLDNRWNDLPVRPVFVSFILGTAQYLSGGKRIAKNYVTGASLPLALTGAASGQVVDPDGNTVLSLADTRREQQIKLNRPGFYEVYTPEGQTVVAVNLDPRESELRKISQEVLDRWQDATVVAPVTAATSAAGVQGGDIVELWRWLLLLLAIVVIGESVLANLHLGVQRMERK